jgi:hypothetical protein
MKKSKFLKIKKKSKFLNITVDNLLSERIDGKSQAVEFYEKFSIDKNILL